MAHMVYLLGALAALDIWVQFHWYSTLLARVPFVPHPECSLITIPITGSLAAVLSSISKVEKSGDATYIWTCEYCGARNRDLTLAAEELPEALTSVAYVVTIIWTDNCVFPLTDIYLQ
jgi:hypothetical protein